VVDIYPVNILYGCVVVWLLSFASFWFSCFRVSGVQALAFRNFHNVTIWPLSASVWERSANSTTTNRKSYISRRLMEKEGKQHYLKILLIGEEMVAL
jgi:hypothetical protein